MKKSGGFMTDPQQFDEKTLVYLRALSTRYPTIDATLAAIARLKAILTLRKGTIHVISDIHGEFKKLIHVINNASGRLRQLVEEVFGDGLDETKKLQLLNLIYYPRETYNHLGIGFESSEKRQTFLSEQLRQQMKILRRVAQQYDLQSVERVFPDTDRSIFRELTFSPFLNRSDDYLESLLQEFVQHGRDLELLRQSAHIIRNLLFSELIIAGDFGDRGPRIDKVIESVMRQPKVAVTWGNHDAHWMGACLGQDACIASVLRMSLRYQRLFQLEMGYGIPIASIEKLARTVYADDPATRFPCLGKGIRDPLSMARMQKAMAMILFKLEGQVIQRNPQFHLDHRALLHRIDPAKGTVEIDGKAYPLLDTHFPTIDWKNPYALSPEEKECMDQMRTAFVQSPTLSDQMYFLARKGSMYLIRDETLIFHGCVPVDEEGNYILFDIDGQSYGGKKLFEAFNSVVHRAFRFQERKYLDLFWYLWSGPFSPLFGKDRIATFEMHFIADKSTHKETKNPYFQFIHDVGFCRKILTAFGVDAEHGLIVNGHVPVKIEEGESPVKRSGQAVTIDGAFSEVYGDKGYTLVLSSRRTSLAQHHHFESAQEVIARGTDMIPTVQDLVQFDRPRTVSDTQDGEQIRLEIAALELLIRAYEESVLPEG
jgi:fructose-1,6-bisphosphatase III